MAFISLEIIFFFERKQVLPNSAFLVVYLLLFFIDERSHNTYELRTRVSFGRINESLSLFHYINNDFHLFGNNFFLKKNKYYLILPFFLSICYLVSLMRGHIIHYRCTRKVQSNIFWGPKYGFMGFKAFSGKF